MAHTPSPSTGDCFHLWPKVLLRDARLPRAQPHKHHSQDPWDLSPTWKGSFQEAVSTSCWNCLPPCPQPSWKVSLRDPSCLLIQLQLLQLFPPSWQGCPGGPRFCSTRTSLKSPWQVLPKVVSLHDGPGMKCCRNWWAWQEPTVTTTKASHASESLLGLGFLVY